MAKAPATQENTALLQEQQEKHMKKVLLALAFAFVALSGATVQAQTPTPKCGYRNKYPPGCLVPIVPLKLEAVQFGNSIILQWNLQPNVETYYVWRYRAGKLELLGSSDVKYFTDETIECNKSYTYVIATDQIYALKYSQKVTITFRCDPPADPRGEDLPM